MENNIKKFIGAKINSYSYGVIEVISIGKVEHENTNWPEIEVKVKDEFGFEYNGLIEVNYPENKLSWTNDYGKQFVWFNI